MHHFGLFISWIRHFSGLIGRTWLILSPIRSFFLKQDINTHWRFFYGFVFNHTMKCCSKLSIVGSRVRVLSISRSFICCFKNQMSPLTQVHKSFLISHITHTQSVWTMMDFIHLFPSEVWVYFWSSALVSDYSTYHQTAVTSQTKLGCWGYDYIKKKN